MKEDLLIVAAILRYPLIAGMVAAFAYGVVLNLRAIGAEGMVDSSRSSRHIVFTRPEARAFDRRAKRAKLIGAALLPVLVLLEYLRAEFS